MHRFTTRTALLAALLALPAAAPPLVATLEAQAITAPQRNARAADGQVDTLELRVTPSVTRYCALKPSSQLSYMRLGLCAFYPHAAGQLRIRVDSLVNLLSLVTPPPVDTTRPPPPDTIVVQPPPVVDTTTPAPKPPAKIGVATVAAFPAVSGSATLPVTSRDVRVGTGAAALQAAFNAARTGDRLLLPRCSSYTGNFVVPQNVPGVLVTTDSVPPAGQRMLPSIALRLCAPKILSPNYQPAIDIAGVGSNTWAFVGLEISVTPAATQTGMNTLVKVGNTTGQQTGPTATPYGFIFDRDYVHGDATLDFRRCFLLNARNSAVVNSTVSECHSNNGDAQAILCYNGCVGLLIANNYLEASHEVVHFGGSDPNGAAMSPQDITLRGNWIGRPASWKGLWQAKNILETKNVCRYLIEDNWIDGVWADAQAGFAFVMKSENQDNTAPYTQTCDVTIRRNIIQNVAAVFNFSGKGSSSNPNVTAARITATGNLVRNVNVGPYTGQGQLLQLLSIITDVAVSHNTFLNGPLSSSYSLGACVFDGAPAAVTFAFVANVVYNGEYGCKGGGQSQGTNSLNTYVQGGAAGYTWQSNQVRQAQCSFYPATTDCGTGPLVAPDGLPVGADTLLALAAARRANQPDVALTTARRVARASELKHRWTPTPPEKREGWVLAPKLARRPQ